jgi:MFS family permease
MGNTSVYSSYRWAMLISACFAIMSVYIDMIAIAPILGSVSESLKVDMASTTNLMMGFVLSTACVLIWGGVVVDKFGMTTATVLGLLCATLPASLMPVIGNSYGLVMVARLIQGASVGFVFATIGPTIALWFPPEEHGIAGGTIIAFISVGSAVGGLISPIILNSGFSWQATVALLSLFGWVSIILALTITRKSPNPEVVEGLMAAMQPSAGQLTFAEAMKLPITWIGALLVFFNSWALYVFLNLVPPYIAAPEPMGIGLGPIMSGRLALAGTIIGIIATIVGGLFFDKIAKGNHKIAIYIGAAMTAVFAVPLTLSPVYSNMGLLVLVLMLTGWGFNFLSPSLSGFIAMNYPPSIVGRMVGWWFGFGTFGGALGLYVGGKTIGATGSFKTAIILISVVSVCVFVLNLFLSASKAKSKVVVE